MELNDKSCIPCRGGVPPLAKAQAKQLQKEIPQWSLLDGCTKIERRYSFRNFVEAMAFSQQVGKIAEEEGHHPDITFGWGYCAVLFYTHKIKGLHENDFIMAAKTDNIYTRLHQG